MPSRPIAAVAAVAALLSAAAGPARAEPVKNVVLVHGGGCPKRSVSRFL
jgi:hypothetical protein